MLDGHGNPQLALFTANGLRLSPQGYALWQQGIDAQLTRMRLQTLPRPPPSPPLLSHCFATALPCAANITNGLARPRAGKLS